MKAILELTLEGFIMSDFETGLSLAEYLIPRPILEYIAPQKGPDDYIGLTKDGRTVNWMRNTEPRIAHLINIGALFHPLTRSWIGAFICTGGLIGAVVGAAVGLGRTIYNRDVSIASFVDMGICMGLGTLMGGTAGPLLMPLCPNRVISNVIASVIVPPVAGIANLVCAPYENNSHDQDTA